MRDYIFRPSRFGVPAGDSELTPSAKAIRQRFNLPINPIRETQIELVIPYDPETESEPFGRLVTAHDRREIITIQVSMAGGSIRRLTGRVTDVQVRQNKGWKKPRFTVTMEV